jgi:hypothetical protein
MHKAAIEMDEGGHMRWIHVRVLILGTLAVSAGGVLAQSSGTYAITHSVVAPAATLSGGNFGLIGTVGQASASKSGAGAYQMTSGYAAALSVPDRIFANGFEP